MTVQNRCKVLRKFSKKERLVNILDFPLCVFRARNIVSYCKKHQIFFYFQEKARRSPLWHTFFVSYLATMFPRPEFNQLDAKHILHSTSPVENSYVAFEGSFTSGKEKSVTHSHILYRMSHPNTCT